MNRLLKWFLTTAFAAALLRTGLDAAPSTGDKNSQLSPQNDKAKTFPGISSQYAHIDDHKFPGFDVRIRDYSTTAKPIQEDDNTFKELLSYLEKTFHFINVVDENKNDLLATDLVDPSDHGWSKYLTAMMPFFERINATDIENPQDDAQGTIWDNLWQSVLKRYSMIEADYTDLNGDGNLENNEIHVEYTTVKFDPVGKFVEKLWNIVRRLAFLDHLWRWIQRVVQDIIKFSVLNPNDLAIDTDDQKEKEDSNVGVGIGGVIIPDGVLHMSHYDPVQFGINTILFIIYNSIFWGVFLRNAGIENYFAEYPDIVPECPPGEECPETDCPEGQQCPAGEGAEGEAAEGGAAEGGAAEGDGGGETNRNDNFYYYDYDYRDQFINRQGLYDDSRTYSQDNSKHRHGAMHYPLPYHQDANIYEKKQ
ncbi:hypothetical protein SK128_007936 [Halocaridina rubra]|uniref:Uncharacterized protein n=1 Tax=Halocaridina rubra TaxID=373956 RepID=A0AAN8X2P5_HALRR